jgi:LacI family transcriptional regulator
VRKKVYEAVKELGYKKNIYASAVAQQKPGSIAILIHEDYEKAYEWNFIRNIFIQLEAIITTAGYSPILLTVSFHTKTADIFEKIVSVGAGALFSIHYGNTELFTLLEDYSIPTIVVNNLDYQERFFTVCSDDFQGAYEGTLHLIHMGHKNIAFFDYERPDFKSCYADRYIGFRKAIEENHITLPDTHRMTVDMPGIEDLTAKMKKILCVKEPPTAIFAHDDYLGAKIVVVLHSMHMNVPDDLSLIAPGDTLDYNQEYIPRITTMQIDTALIGKLAGNLMLDILHTDTQSIQSLKIKQQLVERGSCRKLG